MTITCFFFYNVYLFVFSMFMGECIHPYFYLLLLIFIFLFGEWELYMDVEKMPKPIA